MAPAVDEVPGVIVPEPLAYPLGSGFGADDSRADESVFARDEGVEAEIGVEAADYLDIGVEIYASRT